jgi:hypothetical protein
MEDNRFLRLNEMSMSRKHFQSIADVLKDHKEHMDAESHAKLAHTMGRALAQHNDLFNHDKFVKACGVDKK